MNISLLIIILSLTAQLLAAVVAVRLIVLSDKKTAGVLMLLMAILMALRRSTSLYRLMAGGEIKVDLFAEFIACLISFLLLAGYVYLSSLYTSLRQKIDEHTRAEQSLQNINAKLQALIQAMPDAVFFKDPDGRYLMFNRTFQEYFGAEPEVYIGKTESDFLPPDVAQVCRKNDEQIMRDGRSIHVEEVVAGADGGKRYFESVKAPIYDRQGGILGLLGVSRDVTERKAAEEALRRSHDKLEIVVQERTAELSMMNEQLRNLSVYLQKAREDERTKIAREVHDDLGQSLTALKIDLALLKDKLPGDQHAMAEKLLCMNRLVEATIQSVKRISTDLRPGVLDHLGLTAAIDWQTEEFRKRTGISCDVVYNTDAADLDRDRATTVFRVLQETLTNIVRHAQATRVSVRLQNEGDGLVLHVTDNGKGITERQMSDPKSLGLIGMRERVYSWGGSLMIRGSRNGGTTVTVRIPYNERERIGESGNR